jgi:hypothetical protein
VDSLLLTVVERLVRLALLPLAALLLHPIGCA